MRRLSTTGPTRRGEPRGLATQAPDQFQADNGGSAYQGLGSQWHACAVGHTHPRPELEPEDRKLEARLMNRCHQVYRNMPWWEKTSAFTVGMGLGCAGGVWGSWAPPSPASVPAGWTVAGRSSTRPAARPTPLGALYTHYINAQYLRLLGDRLGELTPSQMLGNEAAEYYRKLDEYPDGHPEPQPARAPFAGQAFDPGNSEHQSHAAAAVEEIFDLANHVCARERKGHDDMLTEAVCQAVLPLKALSGIPELQKIVAEKLSEKTARPAPGRPMGHASGRVPDRPPPHHYLRARRRRG